MLSPEPILDIVRGLSTVRLRLCFLQNSVSGLACRACDKPNAGNTQCESQVLVCHIVSVLQVASGTIVLNQLKNVYEELFYTECDNCRGTGRMTCPICHGRNKCRSRPLTPAAAAKLKMPGKYEEPEDSQ